MNDDMGTILHADLSADDPTRTKKFDGILCEPEVRGAQPPMYYYYFISTKLKRSPTLASPILIGNTLTKGCHCEEKSYKQSRFCPDREVLSLCKDADDKVFDFS